MATKKSNDGFYFDDYPPLVVITATMERWDFTAARQDAITLIRIHDDKTGARAGRPPEELEALKRSALILAVTAWESFVEDTVVRRLKDRLAAATKPADIQSTFNKVAHLWLEPANSNKPKPPDLAKWAGDEWKRQISDALEDDLQTFHTPNTANTNRLFDTYLGVKIKDSWHWQNTTPEQAQNKLDKLIKDRGKVVHRGKRMLGPQPEERPIRRAQVVDALNFLFMLVDATEKKLGCAPSTHT